jgi:para-nitrobenzyl esterase
MRSNSTPFGFRSCISFGLFLALALLLIAITSWSPIARAGTPSPVVNTESGQVQGTVVTGTGTTEMQVEYLGIPYAAAPVGALRWMPSQPYGMWTVPIWQAAAPGSACPQLDPSGGGDVIGNEDCLFLNIYTPLGKTTTIPHNRAVMVWIHGGGLTQGAGADFDPTPLVQRGDVIVVTFNYRLGLLGFFAEQDLDAEGHLAANYGLMDQQSALQWVKDNIAAFGGDPDRVTVFGESAGGLSVYSQLASPLAAGLFNRAISQSGAYGGFSPDYRAVILPIATAETTGYLPFVEPGSYFATAIAAAAGCSSVSTTCLRGATAEEVVNALGSKKPFPVIDGTLLCQTPGDAFSSGEFNQVSVLTGNNRDEYRYFVAENFTQPIDNSQYSSVFMMTFASLAPSVEAQYPLPAHPQVDKTELLLGAAGTDGLFVCSARRAEMYLAKYVPVWAYEFADDKAPPPPSPPFPVVNFPLGAYHSADVQYLFDKGTIPDTGPQARLSHAMISYWTEFAKNGDPNSTAHPYWQPYDPTIEERQFLVAPVPSVESGTDFDTFHECSSYWDTL